MLVSDVHEIHGAPRIYEGVEIGFGVAAGLLAAIRRYGGNVRHQVST